jgi:hypothetical protein
VSEPALAAQLVAVDCASAVVVAIAADASKSREVYLMMA